MAARNERTIRALKSPHNWVGIPAPSTLSVRLFTGATLGLAAASIYTARKALLLVCDDDDGGAGRIKRHRK